MLSLRASSRSRLTPYPRVWAEPRPSPLLRLAPVPAGGAWHQRPPPAQHRSRGDVGCFSKARNPRMASLALLAECPPDCDLCVGCVRTFVGLCVRSGRDPRAIAKPRVAGVSPHRRRIAILGRVYLAASHRAWFLTVVFRRGFSSSCCWCWCCWRRRWPSRNAVPALGPRWRGRLSAR